MIGSFRQSMTWLHTWAGLLFVWIMYFMFVTGTLGYFDTEIDHWMEPELAALETTPRDERIATGLAYLQENAGNAERWFLSFALDREQPHLRVNWTIPAQEEGGDREFGSERLHSVTGEPLDEIARDTGGGQLLYRMHYLLHYLDRDIAYRFIVAAITLIMFIGMISGIIAHKKIFKDFFTFRPKKGQRSWLDMHNLLSVTSLPFLIMISYSGLLFVTTMWMPLIAVGSLGFDTEKASDLIGGFDIKVESAGEPTQMTDVIALIEAAEADWGEGSVHGFQVRQPNDANARILLSKEESFSRIPDTRVYDGVTGEYVQSLELPPSNALNVASVMIALHEGLFAGISLRWLYFLTGLLGTAMVGTGAIYWVSKRRKKYTAGNESFGFRFVEVLNVGTIIGLPIAVAAFFWANRLLPFGLENRGEWEAHVMFAVWGLCILYPMVRTVAVSWRELSWIAAFAYMALPVLNAITTDHGIFSSVNRGDWVMAGFDLTALATGVVFAVAALVMRRGRLAVTKPAVMSTAETAPST
ncbi:MAG: PepSY-associated TM helix domain-containing protein [Pseudomonadota bacterium]